MSNQYLDRRSRVLSTSRNPDEDEKVLGPLLHLLKYPGSDTLTTAFRCLNYWLNVPEEKLKIIEDIIILVQNSLLIIDDVEDNSTIRRYHPAAHTIFGIPLTLNAGMYGVLLAQEKSFSLQHPEAIKIVLDEIMEMHKGQGLDFYWTEFGYCPTEEEAIINYRKKSYSLLGLGIRLMQLFSGNKTDLWKLCDVLTFYYQLRNDYLNLWSDEYQQTKEIPFEDITEGKFSVPIIHAIRNSPNSKQDEIMLILKQRTTNINLKKYCLNLMEEAGSRKYTFDKLKEAYRNIQEEIKRLGGHPELEKLVENTMKLRE